MPVSMAPSGGGIIENSKYSTLPLGRIFTGATCMLVFLLALLLIVVVAPTQNRSGNSTRVCTLLHCGLALLSSSLGLVAAVLNVLPAAFVDASLSAIIAVSMAIDGHLTWQRYLIVHEYKHPSKAQTVLVYAFILVCFSLPFLVSAILWAFEEAADMGKISERDPGKPLVYGGMVLYVFSIPCRICWDTSLGCAVITRIHELRLLIATTTEGGREGRDQKQIEQQHQTLALVARKTIVYICISTSLNLFIHLPLTRMIPFIAAATATYNLTFALASHYSFNSRAGSSDVLLLLFQPFALLSHAVSRAWKLLQRRPLSSSKAQEEVEEQQQEGGRPRWWWRSFALKGDASSRHARHGHSESKLSMFSNKTVNDGVKRGKDGGEGCDLSALRIVVDSQLARMSDDTSEERDEFSGDGLTTRVLEEEEEEEGLLFEDEKVVDEVEEKAKEKEALETLRREEKGKRRSGTSSSFLRRRETMMGSSKAFSGRSSSSSALLHTEASGFEVRAELQEEEQEQEEEEDGEDEEDREDEEEGDEEEGDGRKERRVDRRLRGRRKRGNDDGDQAFCKVVVVSHGNQNIIAKPQS